MNSHRLGGLESRLVFSQLWGWKSQIMKQHGRDLVKGLFLACRPLPSQCGLTRQGETQGLGGPLWHLFFKDANPITSLPLS